MMKSGFIFALVLLVGVCFAAQPRFKFIFLNSDLPEVSEEPNYHFEFSDWEYPICKPEQYISMELPLREVSHAFHFTRIWWFNDMLENAKRSRDEEAIANAQEMYDRAVAQLMNDVIWLGGPREVTVLDEPE